MPECSSKMFHDVEDGLFHGINRVAVSNLYKLYKINGMFHFSVKSMSDPD